MGWSVPLGGKLRGGKNPGEKVGGKGLEGGCLGGGKRSGEEILARGKKGNGWHVEALGEWLARHQAQRVGDAKLRKESVRRKIKGGPGVLLGGKRGGIKTSNSRRSKGVEENGTQSLSLRVPKKKSSKLPHRDRKKKRP